LDSWLLAGAGILGTIIGIIIHYGYILWQKRDILEWTYKYWVDAWQDGKITVEEVYLFIVGLLDKLGMKDKIIVQKKG
jgi:hypothetical protein